MNLNAEKPASGDFQSRKRQGQRQKMGFYRHHLL
jgi:hypothetical protein